MSERKKMSLMDRLSFFGYHFLHLFLFLLEYSIVVTIFLAIGFKIVFNESIIDLINQGELKIVILLIYLFGLITQLGYIIRVLNVLLRRDLYVTQGHIFKKHSFKQRSSDSTTIITKKVRAISNDESVTTDWKTCSGWLYRQNEPQVYIVVHKNKGMDFYRWKELTIS